MVVNVCCGAGVVVVVVCGSECVLWGGGWLLVRFFSNFHCILYDRVPLFHLDNQWTKLYLLFSLS